MALGGLIPKGAAQEIERVAARVRDMDMTEENTRSAQPQVRRPRRLQCWP